MLKKLLYIFQLEGYDVARFKKWLVENQGVEILESKQEIKWTLKAKILYFISILINFLSLGSLPGKSLIFSFRLISWPEKIIKTLIINKAKFKIGKRKDLIVIGVTGSYGKTSVKEILSHILSAKYKVLKTPDSYNTPLGISKIINQELKLEHQVFVVEMGAHQKGDIKALCELVHPQIGIITSIGKQHLERFGSEEQILETKFELMDFLINRGLTVLNINDQKIASYAKNYPQEKIIYYGICDFCTACKLDKDFTCNSTLKVKNIKTTNEGTIFSISLPNGKIETIKTKLLGHHNIQNIMAGINVARYLDIGYEDIEKQCLTLEPIPHRLQLLNGANETTIIDDAFNANPDSAKAAMEVLSEFESPRKIIITPGLVELGQKQEEENRILGKEMAGVADYVLVVGETNREALIDGLESRIMNHESRVETQNIASLQYYSVKSLGEAMEKLKEIVIPGSVILFENDLPDQYK